MTRKGLTLQDRREAAERVLDVHRDTVRSAFAGYHAGIITQDELTETLMDLMDEAIDTLAPIHAALKEVE